MIRTVRDAIMAHGPAAVRALNATTSGDLTFEDPETDMARFDRFPFELRYRLNVNNTKLACGAFEQHLAWARRQGFGPGRTIAKINEFENNEIAVFAGKYRGHYGTTLPHVAAGASIQRYGVPGPSKHPPKPFKRPIYRKPYRPRRRRRQS